MTEIDKSAPVLVTGASGYIAGWIVRYLLEDGYVVRGTVRNPDKATGLEHLHALAREHEGRLTLHAADLLTSGAYTEAMQGCEVVMHTASPFLLGTLKDPQRQLVEPALQGTRNVLDSVNQTPSVKRVVLTSSVVAIYGDNVDMAGKDRFTEADWNTTSTVKHQPYPYSKTVAERAAWELQQAQDRWDLVTIHPGLVLGPSLTSASASGSMEMMKQFTDGSLAAGAPRLALSVVDVRDIARAHLAAAFTPAAHGRYLTAGEPSSLLGVSKVLQQEFGKRWTFPRMVAPKLATKLVAPLVGQSREYIEKNVGYPLDFDSSRITRELGVTFRPARESIREHYQQMIDEGLAKGASR